jgi:hypothetical protein
MFELITEYGVKEDNQGRFELIFGPGGVWSKLFAKDPRFRGMTVLRDANSGGRYLTIEVWDDCDRKQQILTENEQERLALDKLFEELGVVKKDMGIFSLRAEAAVRPLGNTMKKSGEARGRAKRKPF